MFQTINPATGEVVASYEYVSEEKIKSTLKEASYQHARWKKVPLSERAETVRKLAKRFRAEKEALANLMTKEMGKSHQEGVAEIEKCADTFDYFADHAVEFLKAEKVAVEKAHVEIAFESMGVILSIMPWNFPFWQFVRFAAPSLIIGNVILLKHAAITAGCAERIEAICREVTGEALIYNLRLNHEQTARVIADPIIQGVTFTGSTQAGREIAKTAGQNLKKSVLELGGSDAYLVLEDADIPLAAKKCAAGRMINHGQSCVAAKRFVVLAPVFESFLQAFKAEMEKFEPRPLAHKKFKDQLEEQVQKLKAHGGKMLLGENAGSLPEAVYPPGILVFEKDSKEAHQEELFGPVAMVFRAASVQEALQIANQSPYGLGGGIFSKDAERADKIVRENMEAGFVTVNDTVRSDPRLPFGGVKDSGYGRELSVHGFREFCNIKTVYRGS